MFTLSDASKDTKLFLKWAAIVVSALLALFLLIKITLFIKELIFPTPPPKPTVAFGKLQPAVFPESSIDKNLIYKIDTLSGELPVFKDQLKVYVIEPYKPDLLSLDKLQTKVYSVGFKGRPVAISEKLFDWQSNPELPGILRTIRGNRVSFDFTITSDYSSNAAILEAAYLQDEKKSISVVKRTLESMELLTGDIDMNKTKTKLFAIRDGNLTPSTSLSNSDIVEVDLYQKNVDKLPIYYENPNSSNMTFLLGTSFTKDTDNQIVGANFIHQKVSNRSSTYPIKTTEEAFDELINGKAYVGSYFGTSKTISIRNVTLGYYIGKNPQDFLLPIFVFHGDDGFIAYVSAVKGEWINK